MSFTVRLVLFVMKQKLIKFEEEIKDLFLKGKIRFPVHFSGGNEDDLIEIFKEIKDGDWVFSTHRNHYHALLHNYKGLKDWIIKNGSMHVYGKKFFTSGIVGGAVPIALGVAEGIKIQGGTDRVWCFVGDMAARTGIFHESAWYAAGHSLPITFIIEDNGMSVETPTEEAWGRSDTADIRRYEYFRTYGHQGAGTHVIF